MALIFPLSAVAAAACSGQTTPAAPGGQTSSSPVRQSSSSARAPAGSRNGPPAASSAAATTQRAAPVESNPPGDIPDSIAYVPYRNTAGRYTFLHPEGWANEVHGATVTFTDKLNGVTATGMAAAVAPTVASAKQDVARLRTTQPAFELRSVKPATLPSGTGVLIVFRRNSAPDPVTGKVFRDEVERYVIYRGGREVVLDLYGAVGSDNVDSYTKISQSLRLS